MATIPMADGQNDAGTREGRMRIFLAIAILIMPSFAVAQDYLKREGRTGRGYEVPWSEPQPILPDYKPPPNRTVPTFDEVIAAAFRLYSQSALPAGERSSWSKAETLSIIRQIDRQQAYRETLEVGGFYNGLWALVALLSLAALITIPCWLIWRNRSRLFDGTISVLAAGERARRRTAAALDDIKQKVNERADKPPSK
jgi:hypothetical protein